MTRYAARPLKAGQRVRLVEDGPAWEVLRVTACSATVKRRGERVQVTVPKREDPLERRAREARGEEAPTRTFEAWEGGGVVTISAGAFVFEAEP